MAQAAEVATPPPVHPVDALVSLGVPLSPEFEAKARAICDERVPGVTINRDLKNEGRRWAIDIARGMAATVGITCTVADIVQRLREAAEQKPPSQAAGFHEIADEMEKHHELHAEKSQTP